MNQIVRLHLLSPEGVSLVKESKSPLGSTAHFSPSDLDLIRHNVDFASSLAARVMQNEQKGTQISRAICGNCRIICNVLLSEPNQDHTELASRYGDLLVSLRRLTEIVEPPGVA